MPWVTDKYGIPLDKFGHKLQRYGAARDWWAKCRDKFVLSEVVMRASNTNYNGSSKEKQLENEDK